MIEQLHDFIDELISDCAGGTSGTLQDNRSTGEGVVGRKLSLFAINLWNISFNAIVARSLSGCAWDMFWSQVQDCYVYVNVVLIATDIMEVASPGINVVGVAGSHWGG
jgi:hypothetical protein